MGSWAPFFRLIDPGTLYEFFSENAKAGGWIGFTGKRIEIPTPFL